MIGFAKLIGELIDGLIKVMAFFAVAALIATAIIYAYTRCVRSTALVIACSLVAVVWQLGLVALFGFELDPFSILVPFLVFAIGVSHGAQKMNGIMQDIGRGTQKLVAARYTFRRLFLAGLTALLADAVGFAVLMVIDIPGDPRPRAHREHRRRRAHLHQPAAAAGAALLHRRERERGGAQPARGAGGAPRQGPGRGCGRSSTASPRATGRSARSPCRWRWRRRDSPSPSTSRSATSIPARRSCGAEFALQPGQRLHHRALRAVLRPVRGDREDRQGRLPQVRNAGRRRPPGVGAAPGARRADDGLAGRCRAADHRRLVRGQPEVAHAQPQPGRAELRGAAGVGQQPRPLQHRVLGDAGDRVSRRPQGGDAGSRGGRRGGIRRHARRQGSRSSCSPRAAPASRRRPTSWSSRRTARCCSTSTRR